MDLNKEFKDLNIPEGVEKEAKQIEENLPENKRDLDENERIVKDLEERLKKINEKEDVDEEEEDIEEEATFYEKVQPFIIPICLTIFALIFAALFLYFFSQSRVEKTPPAIVNSGNIEPAYYPQQPAQIVVKEEPIECVEPQILNDAGDGCIDPPVQEEEPEPEKAGFENGTTTIAHVRFSFDKFSYDNKPRGIYMLEDQIFSGDYTDYKINPSNRAYANDYFFGVDRYMVSLIGDCSYTIDDARILVKNMTLGNNTFTGNVVKIIEASKPHIVCSPGQRADKNASAPRNQVNSGYNTYNDPAPGQD